MGKPSKLQKALLNSADMPSPGMPVPPRRHAFTIPRSFKLFGRTMKVRYDPALIHYDNVKGQARMRDGEIRLQSDSAGTPQSRTQVEQTFCHELVHCILNVLAEKDLCADEPFVERFGCALHQALTTSEGDLDK